jgi:hypothetical protein
MRPAFLASSITPLRRLAARAVLPPLVLSLTMTAATSAARAAAVTTPPENLAKGAMPPLAPAEAMAKRLLDAIVADDPDAVRDAFFPREPFLELKAIQKPGDYWDQLMSWFVADVHREHERLKPLGKLAFDSFAKGGCVWKDKGSEANKIAYWSCYKNRFYARPVVAPEPTATGAKAAKKPERVEIQLRAMINWGADWYVTHLGPIPKS